MILQITDAGLCPWNQSTAQLLCGPFWYKGETLSRCTGSHSTSHFDAACILLQCARPFELLGRWVLLHRQLQACMPSTTSLLAAERQVRNVLSCMNPGAYSELGLVLANRLTEDASVSVMVLEAGGDGLGKRVILSMFLIRRPNAQTTVLTSVLLRPLV
jgi:hypothetical protein